MAIYKQYTLDELWYPPEAAGEGIEVAFCPMMNAIGELLRHRGHMTVTVMAIRLGISTEALYGGVEAITGVPCTEWIANWTMRDARWLLDKTRKSIGDIGRRLGYRTVSSFSRAFQRHTGQTPTDYRIYGAVEKKHP